MPTLTPTELTRYRAQTEGAKLYLSFFRPSVLGYATLAAYDRGTRSLDIASFSGNLNSINAGMTAFVGTANGAYNLGRVRIKSRSGTTLNIAENSIFFPAGATLTIWNNYEIWPVYPRVEANGALQIWEDYDISYTDQNDRPDPVVIMGCGDGIPLSDGLTGQAQSYFDFSDSYSPYGAALSYYWEFEGGTPFTGTTATPGYITWTAPGYYWAHCRVTDANGKEFTGHRPVVIHDTGDYHPVTKFELTSLRGSWNGRGWTADIRVHDLTKLDTFPDRGYCLIWREDWWQSEMAVMGRLVGREKILFAGWIDSESIARKPRQDYVDFRVLGTVPFMEKLTAFPVTLEHSAEPDNWWQINRPTVDKAVNFYLRWHTTALALADFTPGGDPKLTEYVDFDGENVTTAVDTLTYDKSVFNRFASDQYGRMFLETEAQMYTGTVTYVLDTSDADWREEEVFSRTPRDVLNWVELNGVYFDGNTRPSTPVISKAPGDAPFAEGGGEVVMGLITPDQAGLNALAGLYLAWKNNDIPELRLPMAGNWANAFDIIPQETVRVSLNGNETNRGLVLDNAQMIVREVEHRYDRRGNLLTDLTCEQRTDGLPGVPGDYPSEIPPPRPCDDCTPPCVPCTFCDPAYPCTEIPNEDRWMAEVYLGINLDNVGAIKHTHDFSGPETLAQPVWDDVTANLPTAPFTRMIGDPFNPHGRQWVMVDQNGGEIYGNAWSGVEVYDWVKVLDAAQATQVIVDAVGNVPLFHSGGSEALMLSCLHANINIAGLIATAVQFRVNSAGGNIVTYFVYSTDYGNTWNAGGQILDSVLFASTFRRMEISDCLAGSDIYVPYSWQLTQTGISYNGDGGGDVFDVFEKRSTDLPAAGWWSTHDIYLDPSDPAVLYTFGDGDLYRSLDGGQSWDQILTTTDSDVTDYYTISPTFADGIPCGIGRCGVIRVITDHNSDYNLRWATDAFVEDMPTFHGPRPGTGDITGSEGVGISLVHSARNYLYGIKMAGAGSDTTHVIFVVDHDRTDTTSTADLNWVGKGGVNRDDATTTGIPGRANAFDILQVWVSR